MKKIALFLLICLCISTFATLTSCDNGNVQEESAKDEPTKEETTVDVTEKPTETSTAAPTEESTQAPTEEPTQAPTQAPEEITTEETTEIPTEETTEILTEETTEAPTEETTEAPTEETTEIPTEETTEIPTEETTEAPTEERNTVEESEWKDLFSGTNFTLIYDGNPIYQIMVFKDENLIYDYMEYDGEGFGLYLECLTDDAGAETWWMYEEVSYRGDWLKEIDNRGNGERMREIIYSFFTPFADIFSQFTYDEENAQYTVASVNITYMGTSQELTDVKVKCSNGKLVEITYVFQGTNFTINEVGTSDVTLPEMSWTVTEEEWNAIISSDDFNNVFIREVEDYESVVDGHIREMSIATNIKITEEAVAITSYKSDSAAYAVKKDGVWYEVTRDDGYYIGVECDEDYVKENYSFYGMFGKILENQYSSFTYNEELMAYVKSSGGDEIRVYFRCGKISVIEHVTAGGEKMACEFGWYGDMTYEELDVPEFEIK